MFRAFSKLIFCKVWGWKILGDFPHHLKKYVVIVAPHTSNCDFLVGVFSRSITRVGYAKYLGKSELFRFPYGWIFRAMGGHPVDRTKHNNLVDAVVDIFDSHERFVIALAPEGTRKKVEKFKTGFYYIAEKAQIPLVMVSFDYTKKEIEISQPFDTTGDFVSDMGYIMTYFKGKKGKNPELGIGEVTF